MSMLYAPWREDYVTKKNKPAFDGCLFCSIIAHDQDEEQFVVKRYAHSILMLNRFPYASGHLLVIPVAHGAQLQDFDTETLNEIMQVTKKATDALIKIMRPNAFNIGCNLGAQAGAGIPAHLHQHIIPRWGADIGFLELIGQTTTINIDLKNFYEQLKITIE
jgi:ATP adenylyltransferase